MDPSLGGDLEIGDRTAAVARQQTTEKALVFFLCSLSKVE
jgi:hypothetical protein